MKPAQRATAAAKPSGPAKWQVDSSGQLLNFNMRVLRSDILYRLRGGHPLYTTVECKLFLTEIIRATTQWQEEELATLIYLSDLYEKLLPGRLPHFQFPVSSTVSIPFSTPADALHDNAVDRVVKVVEELNRSLVRMIDRVWNERRERLVLAAAMLEGIEDVARAGGGGDASE